MTQLLLLVTAIVFVSSCGKSDDDKKADAATVYGKLDTTLLAETAVHSYNLTTATCVSDSNSGLLTASFTGDQNSRLDVRLKGFSTQAKTYTCTQSSDNKQSSVGQKFDGCMVEIVVPDATSGLNTYDMHRTAESVKAFSYDKTCTVKTEYAAPKVTLTVDCDGLIQTVLQGAPRNPIATTETATVKGTSSAACNI